MRITGGLAKGISLKTTQHSALRPATDAMREAVFSSLGPLVVDASVVDLFAGTGAYGLEALSRGAQCCTFVEKERAMLACLTENLGRVLKSMNRADAPGVVHAGDVLKWNPPAASVGLIFVDPPYGQLGTNGLQVLWSRLRTWLQLTDASRVVLELPGECPAPKIDGMTVLKRLGKQGKNQPSVLIYGLGD